MAYCRRCNRIGSSNSSQIATFRNPIQARKENSKMRSVFGELLFWGFLLVILVIFIRDQANAVALTKGMVSTYTGGITDLANLGGPAPSAYQSA
jgi:hypothetical protein